MKPKPMLLQLIFEGVRVSFMEISETIKQLPIARKGHDCSNRAGICVQAAVSATTYDQKHYCQGEDSQ